MTEAVSQLDASTPDTGKAVGVYFVDYVDPVALLSEAAGCVSVWAMWCCITGRQTDSCILA